LWKQIADESAERIGGSIPAGDHRMAGKRLLVDTDVFIDYLRGILPACALLDSDEFDIYYFSWRN